MELIWQTLPEMVGVGFGYTTHQKMLRKALEEQGVNIIPYVQGEDASRLNGIAVSIVTAGTFIPVPNCKNILYTMYECVDIPQSWIPKLQLADLIVVPCTHNKKLFEKYTDRPIEVCWEGVDLNKYTFIERTFPTKRPFVYLWVGASNERKGYVHVSAAVALFNKRNPELYDRVLFVLKTTQLSDQVDRIVGFKDGKPVYQKMPRERVFTAGNAIVDTRVLPVVSETGDSLVKLYHSAHAFLFPTMGEGFGLTLAEAMSTGLPCIYTPWSGPVDFISEEEGYPLKWKFVKIKAMTPMADGTFQVDLESYAASADVDHLVRRMEQVYYGYDEALKKGKKARERIERDITWEKSAKRFIEIVNTYFGG